MVRNDSEGKKLRVRFALFVMNRIYSVLNASMTDNREVMGKIMEQMEIQLWEREGGDEAEGTAKGSDAELAYGSRCTDGDDRFLHPLPCACAELQHGEPLHVGGG
jgi:hypothetical protein